jgi:hypothetical protein
MDNNPLQQPFTDDDGIEVIVTKDPRPNVAGEKCGSF